MAAACEVEAEFERKSRVGHGRVTVDEIAERDTNPDDRKRIHDADDALATYLFHLLFHTVSVLYPDTNFPSIGVRQCFILNYYY